MFIIGGFAWFDFDFEAFFLVDDFDVSPDAISIATVFNFLDVTQHHTLLLFVLYVLVDEIFLIIREINLLVMRAESIRRTFG